MRLLSVLHHQAQLFRTHKALESRTPLFLRLHDNRLSIHPLDILCLREERSQQLILAAHVHIHHAVRNANEATLTQIDAIAGSARIEGRKEFNEAVHRLAGDTVHDDMDGWAKVGRDELGMISKEGDEQVLVDVVGNLWKADSLA